MLIGEAVLALMDENTPVSWNGILAKLEAGLTDERDESRAGLLKAAIQDVSTEMKLCSSDAKGNDESQVAANGQNHGRLTHH